MRYLVIDIMEGERGEDDERDEEEEGKGPGCRSIMLLIEPLMAQF